MKKAVEEGYDSHFIKTVKHLKVSEPMHDSSPSTSISRMHVKAFVFTSSLAASHLHIPFLSVLFNTHEAAFQHHLELDKGNTQRPLEFYYKLQRVAGIFICGCCQVTHAFSSSPLTSAFKKHIMKLDLMTMLWDLFSLSSGLHVTELLFMNISLAASHLRLFSPLRLHSRGIT